jgi:hypothetical protein
MLDFQYNKTMHEKNGVMLDFQYNKLIFFAKKMHIYF